MTRILSNNKWLQYYMPVTLTLFMLVTIKRTVVTDGAYDRLFGLPIPYISNNYSYSFHYDIYVGALLFDLITYLALVLLLFKIVEKFGLRLRTHWIQTLIGILISTVLVIIFCLITQESSFKLTNNIPFEIINKQLIFGINP